MAWTDIFIPSGSQTAAEQQANFSRLEQLAQERERQRQAQGDPIRTDLRNVGGLMAHDEGVAAEFGRGALEGLANVTSATKKTLAGTVNAIFSAIPWQVWALGAVGLFIYMGGGIWLKGALAKLNRK